MREEWQSMTLLKIVVKILEIYHFGVNIAKITKKITANYDNSTSFKKKHFAKK